MALRKAARRRGDLEDDHQRALFQWIACAKTTRGLMVLEHAFHVPNGGRRPRVEAARFVALGVVPGIPDVVLPVPRFVCRVCGTVRHDRGVRHIGLLASGTEWPAMCPRRCEPMLFEYAALYIELKRPGGRLSKSQQFRCTRLRHAGNAVAVAYGWDQARATLEWYCGATAIAPAAVRHAIAP